MRNNACPALTALATIACLTGGLLRWAMAGERVGFLDDCSSATGWVVGAWPGITGMASITSDGQQTTFTTLTGTFMTGASAAWAPNWPDWDRNASAGLAMISRKYPGTVDLDRYHYLVARMTAAGTYMALAVNGWDTKAWYTTGLHAVDLRDIPQPSLRGMQPIERTVFQDTSTGATVWRLTRSVRTESCDSFSPDGSALPLYNRSFKGMVLYDFARGGLRELPDLRGAPVFSHSNPSVFYLLQSSARDGKAHCSVQAANLRTGELQVVTEWDSTDEGSSEFGPSPYSDLLLLGLKEGRALFVLDPHAKDPNARVRRVPLPMRMKGSYLSHEDQRVNWQRCYYFQRWQMDLASGKVQLAAYPPYGGHEIIGGDTLVGRYGSMLLSHKLGLLPLDEARANEVRIWSNWATPVPSDYGQLSPDDRWLVTNGTEGEVAGKRLLIDGHETGTVLQIVHDFSSRNSWDSNTYTRVSPDATKLAHMCDMLGDTDVYVALARRPQAFRGVVLAREGRQVRLRWQPPAAAREVAGYNVYRTGESGRSYQWLNRDRVTGTEFVDASPPATAFYAVAAEEHSGVEGLYSQKVHTGPATRFRLYAEVEEGDLTPPLRQHFDGLCANFRCARVWKETPQESTGAARLTLTVPAQVSFVLWVRARGEGSFRCQAGGATTTGQVASAQWSWTRADRPLVLPAGEAPVTIASDADGLCLDRVLPTSETADRPGERDARDPVPSPVEGLRATTVTAHEVRLTWIPSPDLDLDFYSVYIADRPDFVLGNATVLTSGKSTDFLDWGFKPGSTLYYKVVAINKRGVAAKPATLRVQVPNMETATLELAIADAELTEGLARGEAKGFAFAHVPTPLPKDAPRPKATWAFAAPVEGTYYRWARYTTFDAKQASLLWIEVDGDQRVNGTNWRLRFPNTLTRHLDGVKPGEETWFTDKAASGWWAGPTDSVTLNAGPHTLSVAFEPTHAPNGPRLSAVFLSNDPSYRPPGYDPRVDFRK